MLFSKFLSMYVYIFGVDIDDYRGRELSEVEGAVDFWIFPCCKCTHLILYGSNKEKEQPKIITNVFTYCFATFSL